MNSKEFTLCSGSFEWGGSIISFTQVKLTFPYIFLLDDFSLYFSISWLFQMGSHWSHWTAKSSLCALAVLNGGSIVSFTWVKLTTKISLYFLISWLFRMGYHWWHWITKSSLCALAVSNGGFIVSFTWVNLKIWAPRHLGVIIKKVFLLCIRPISNPHLVRRSWKKC